MRRLRGSKKEEMKSSCGMCIHYCQKSHIVTTGQLNVSGRLARYRVWSKHRCNLKQEDLYPDRCNFELDVERQKELNEKFPDLAFISMKLKSFSIK